MMGRERRVRRYIYIYIYIFSIKVRKGFIKGSHNCKLVYYRPPGLHGSGKEIALSRQKSSTESVDLYHWVLILEYIENKTWACGYLEFLLSFSNGSLTRSLHSLVRHQVEREERNSIYISNHALF